MAGPVTMSPKSRRLRGKLAADIRHGSDPERVIETRQALKVARAEEYIQRLVDETPPLTDADRVHLTRLLTNPTT